jgi:hypothetical protein
MRRIVKPFVTSAAAGARNSDPSVQRRSAGAGLLNTHEATGIERTRPLSLSWHCQCPQIAGHTGSPAGRGRAWPAALPLPASLSAVFCALRSESCPSACQCTGTFMVPACACGRACASAGGGLGGQVGSGLYSRVGRTWSPPLRGSVAAATEGHAATGMGPTGMALPAPAPKFQLHGKLKLDSESGTQSAASATGFQVGHPRPTLSGFRTVGAGRANARCPAGRRKQRGPFRHVTWAAK